MNGTIKCVCTTKAPRHDFSAVLAHTHTLHIHDASFSSGTEIWVSLVRDQLFRLMSPHNTASLRGDPCAHKSIAVKGGPDAACVIDLHAPHVALVNKGQLILPVYRLFTVTHTLGQRGLMICVRTVNIRLKESESPSFQLYSHSSFSCIANQHPVWCGVCVRVCARMSFYFLRRIPLGLK